MPFQPVNSEDRKKTQKAVSSVDLSKTDSLRKNSQDGRFVSLSCVFESSSLIFFSCFWPICITVPLIWDRVRGKMRFWGKTKYGEKKTSREKLICGADSLDGDDGDTGPLLGEGTLTRNQKNVSF